MILFDLTPGADPEQHPVVRFRAIKFEGGPAPDFLPEWQEVARLELMIQWAGLPKRPTGTVFDFTPRRALGAIDGFFHRHAIRTSPKLVRKWGPRARTGVTAKIAFDSPGEWRRVKALYRLFGKSCPWCLTRYGVPQWVVEEVRL